MTSQLTRRIVLLGLTLTAGLAFAAPATQPAKPYPLKTCLVSDEDLSSMGEPVVLNHDGQEIKFCCAGCTKSFKKNPAKYLKKLDKAEPTTKPVG